MTPALIKRYFNQGAEIVIESDLGSIQLSDTYENAKKATDFIGKYHNDRNFRIIIRPKAKAKLQRVKLSQVSLEGCQPAFGWILSGTPSNWKVAFGRNIWGVKSKHKALWQQIKKDDVLFLYATKPISGLIGIAKATGVMKEKEPYWPDEIIEGRVKYPYRIEFKPVKILDERDWESRKISISHLGSIYFQGINPIRNKELLKRLDDIAKDI
jgi:hypothetical protein